MKWFMSIVLFFVSCSVALAQQPVRMNLLEYFDKVMPPPASAKRAYDKCLSANLGHPDQVVADSIFKPLAAKLQQIQSDIATPPDSPQAEFMKKMQDPEFQKKLKNMSEDDKMKMAMEMNQSMGVTPGPTKPEPRTVIACMEEVGKLDEAAAGQMRNVSGNVQTIVQHKQELDAKHSDIDTWEQEEIKKLPEQEGQGEEGGPDPKAVYAIRMNAVRKHLAIVDEELRRTDKLWEEDRANSKKHFTPFEKSLEKTHFGADAKNQMSKTNLSTGQILMIGSISNLISESQNAYQDAANWYARLIALEKTNQQ